MPRWLQVYALGIKLLDGPTEVQHFPIEDILPSMEWRPQVVIAVACIADPFVLLHFSDGSAVLLSGDVEEGRSPAVAITLRLSALQIQQQWAAQLAMTVIDVSGPVMHLGRLL